MTLAEQNLMFEPDLMKWVHVLLYSTQTEVALERKDGFFSLESNADLVTSDLAYE